jgi:putative exporter of polyketide antibiotics
MKRHAASHGAAVIVCSVVGALITDVIRKYVPAAYKSVNWFSKSIVDALSISYPPEWITTLIYATILAVIWGVAFALMSKRQ